jgi:hypothetical protein
MVAPGGILERSRAGSARILVPQPRGYKVDDFLSHETVGGELAADDTDEAVGTGGLLVIDDGMGTGQGAGCRFVRRWRSIERTHAGPGTQGAPAGDFGYEQTGLSNEEVDLPRFDGQVLGVGSRFIRRSENRDGAYRDDDVSIRRGLTAIQDRVNRASGQGKHRAFAERQREGRSCSGGDLACPGPGGIDNDPSLYQDRRVRAGGSCTNTGDMPAVCLNTFERVV